MCNSSGNLFCVGLGDNFVAKNNETAPVKTVKPNSVAILVLSGTVASFTAKIFSSVMIANREAILPTTFAVPARNSKHYSEFE